MEEQPEAAPAVPERSSAPVQRHVLSDVSSSSWLDDDTEESASAQRLDRLVEDYNLVTMLALGGFQGSDYAYFETELAKYGIAVISSWLRRRLIFAKCRERGFGGLPEPPVGSFDDPDTVSELASETVAQALYHFRSDVLLKGRWDPRKGASVRTYFVGQCLIRFANVYRRWWNNEARRDGAPADTSTLAALDPFDRRQPPSVEDLVVEQASVDRALQAIKDPRVRRALAFYGAGYTYREIAARLETTEKAVERMIANERTRMRRRGIA